MKKYIVTIKIEDDIVDDNCLDTIAIGDLIGDAFDENGIDCDYSVVEK